MTVATTYSRAQIGVDAPLVTVEADINQGLPQIVIVGLPETAVKESKDRVKAALVNSGFTLPSRKVTINLAPADLPKQGGRYDLAIALALLAASDQISAEDIQNNEYLGELSLAGDLRPISGTLPAVLACGASRNIILPAANAAEVSLASAPNVQVANSLGEVIRVLRGHNEPTIPIKIPEKLAIDQPKLDEVRGQHLAKRALTIAAAGAHNLLFVGPPGTGKTMLAQRLPGLLPDMTLDESLTIAAIQSVLRHSNSYSSWAQRPFRCPHHTASGVALVGGGNPPLPGEISLAHQGVLFLDELPEFSRHVLEVLREPLESGSITISRAQHQVNYPAQFQLVAAMNPCPCGYYGDGTNRCDCTIDRIERYKGKVSGPLLDRIDLHVKVPALARGELTSKPKKSKSNQTAIKHTIDRARTKMQKRIGKPNAQLSSQEVEQHCHLCKGDLALLEHAMDKLALSVRGYYKVLKVARTIADLSGRENIETPDLSEALAFRDLERGVT